MGAIHFSAEGTIKSCYRTNELISAVEHLIKCEWDIEKVLPETIPAKHLLYNPATLLKSLYASVKKAMAAEITQVDEVLKKVEGYVGKVDKDNLVSTLSSIQELFSVFAQNGILGANDLRTKYPKVAAQWHEKLNGNLTPEDVTAGSHKKVWWKCGAGHIWKSVIYSRTNGDAGCPVCADKKNSPYYDIDPKELEQRVLRSIGVLESSDDA